MATPVLLDRYELLAAWRRVTPNTDFVEHYRYELDELGGAVLNPPPSGRRQIVLTDVYCQLTEEMGHFAAMSVAVTTRSFGVRVPDVVWMPCDKWEGFDRDDPVPFVPDLCVEVLLDSGRTRDIDQRVKAYLDGGATEVIIVGQRGEIEFWSSKGRRQASFFGVTLPLDRMYFDVGGAAADRSVRC